MVGTIKGEKSIVITPKPGDLSGVPYAEPLWLAPAYHSPYYNDSHRRLQKAARIFNDEIMIPYAQARESDGKHIEQEFIETLSKNGILHMRLGPGKHLHGVDLLGGAVKGSEFDFFHDLVLAQEGSRINARGFQDGSLSGMVIGLPCIMNYMKDEKRKKTIMDDVFAGRKKICLAITEAFAGSDVAGIRCTAKKTADGKHYIVNGTKKWITNGVFCDYFVTAVKTEKGLSVLLIERSEGVETKPIKTSYSTTAGTTYITFDNVKVPAENLLGEENKGIYVVLANFNHGMSN